MGKRTCKDPKEFMSSKRERFACHVGVRPRTGGLGMVAASYGFEFARTHRARQLFPFFPGRKSAGSSFEERICRSELVTCIKDNLSETRT